VIGHSPGAAPLLDRAGIEPGPGLIALDGSPSIQAFVKTSKAGRVWEREPP
jgi:hypothetical protein